MKPLSHVIVSAVVGVFHFATPQLTMEAIQTWLVDGGKNSENFFLDDGDYPAVDGCACVCVGGIFVFYVTLAAPHSVAMKNQPSSPALRRFLQLTAGTFATVDAALTKATQAYLQISDALDAENAEDDATQEDDDVFAEAAAAGKASADAERRRRQLEMDAEFERIKSQYDVMTLPKPAIERILSDFNAVRQGTHYGWKAAPDGRNLALWNIELFDFDKGSSLEGEMKQVAKRTGKAAIELTMKFPREYPFKPPFIRVVRPRFVMHTARITIGGSICTQLLTDEGWKPIYDIESVIETIRQQITDPESKAKVDLSNASDYTEAEALEAFHRVAEHHKRVGW
jgi:ubiquitin-conjugating enzyme E2 Q